MHASITEEEIALVNRRMGVGQIDPVTGKLRVGETAQEWYDRNKAMFGEDVAVIWFKQKAAKQAIAEANKNA